jgi:poly(hydroxyalkanoate) depolymerase family esterase
MLRSMRMANVAIGCAALAVSICGWSGEPGALRAGKSVTASYSGPEGAREYAVWVPADYAKDRPAPLLVALHGCGQAPGQFAGLARLDSQADKRGFLVVYPNQAQTANPLRCWNWFLPINQARTGEAALIAGIVNEVRAAYAVDARRIYVAGLSAGGLMSSILLACYPEVFAAAAIASGGMYGAATSLEEAGAMMKQGSPHAAGARGRDALACAAGDKRLTMPVFVVQGSADKLVAPVNAEQALAQFAQTNDLADDGKDNDSVRAQPSASVEEAPAGKLKYTVRDYEAGDDALMQLLWVEGLGHAWSGGDPAFPYAEPNGPDATALMFDFFDRHRR